MFVLFRAVLNILSRVPWPFVDLHWRNVCFSLLLIRLSPIFYRPTPCHKKKSNSWFPQDLSLRRGVKEIKNLLNLGWGVGHREGR